MFWESGFPQTEWKYKERLSLGSQSGQNRKNGGWNCKAQKEGPGFNTKEHVWSRYVYLHWWMKYLNMIKNKSGIKVGLINKIIKKFDNDIQMCMIFVCRHSDQ